jgi:hypothetical protein
MLSLPTSPQSPLSPASIVSLPLVVACKGLHHLLPHRIISPCNLNLVSRCVAPRPYPPPSPRSDAHRLL